MKVSLIIAFYKDVEALSLIFAALRYQTYTNFEVVIAEDDEAPETTAFLEKNNDLDTIHIHHPDIDITKNVAQNKAICASNGDYLIFIDGDCVPYSAFIANHVVLAEKGKVLSGRRVNLGSKISGKLRKKELSLLKLEKFYLAYYPILALDATSHIEQGIYLNPNGWMYAALKKRKSNLNILGCNFSCFKKDMVEINGFDESYGHTAVADDTDLQWRFEAYGMKMKSCKFAANIYHLYHYRAPECYESQLTPELELMYERKTIGNYKAHKGLDSH